MTDAPLTNAPLANVPVHDYVVTTGIEFGDDVCPEHRERSAAFASRLALLMRDEAEAGLSHLVVACVTAIVAADYARAVYGSEALPVLVQLVVDRAAVPMVEG